MHHVIAIRQALIVVYRSILMFYIALSMGCGSEGCCGNQNKSKNPEGVDQADLDGPDKLDSSIKEAKKLKKLKKLKKRITKVDEGKQAIVLMHGLARASGDFDAMIAVLKRMFPHALIVALKGVDKDSTKAKSSSLSSTLSIKEQTVLAYEEIKTNVPHGSHLLIVGHSQGGLRGFTLVKEYSSRLKHEDGIVIDRLITIATPWKGAPIFDHIKNVYTFNQKFNQIECLLDNIEKDYSKAVRGYFFKKAPNLAKNHPNIYQKVALPIMKWKGARGALDLDPESDFIRHYVASGLREVDLPITAIAGVLTDFSKLFEPFPSSIGPQALAQLNATYAALIGGDTKCEHDMLLPLSTQHAEGLVTKDFKRIKVYGACHGNKVGVSVKRGLSQLNNKEVIQKVVESIEATFYEEEEETFVEEEEMVPPAA